MSHTIRRRRCHTSHQRGRPHLPDVERRPRALRAVRKHRSQDELGKLVTDHAIVRWMECIVGIDLRARFIADLLSQDRAEMIASMSHGKVRVNDTDVMLSICNGKVVTVAIRGSDA